MGTRADFYVGEGESAEWIGSVAWDGYEWGERIHENNPDPITLAKTESDYRKAVSTELAGRDDGTSPDKGWPWPWDDSTTTDCAYCFVDGEVKPFRWGCAWLELEADEDGPASKWPVMDRGAWARPGTARSGTLVVSS